jgi:DUF4097 and DUF4098 domain-containing protein YvlB
MAIQAVSEVIRAETVNGSIAVEGARGFVELSTVSGSLDMEAGKVDEVTMQAVTGAITFNGIPTRSGSFKFSTHSGSIDLAFPGVVDADFEIMNYNGSLDIDEGLWSLPRSMASKAGMPKEVRFSTGSGGAQIKAETFSGTISIKKD